MLSPRADDHSLTHALAALELMGGMSKTDHTLLRSLGISPGTQPLQSQLGLPGMGIWSPGLQAHTVPPPHCPPSDVGASFSSLGAAAHALAAAAVAVSSPRLAPTPTPNHAFSSAMASWLDNTAAAAMSQAYPVSMGCIEKAWGCSGAHTVMLIETAHAYWPVQLSCTAITLSTMCCMLAPGLFQPRTLFVSLASFDTVPFDAPPTPKRSKPAAISLLQGSQGMDHLRHSIDNTNPGKYGVRRRLEWGRTLPQ